MTKGLAPPYLTGAIFKGRIEMEQMVKHYKVWKKILKECSFKKKKHELSAAEWILTNMIKFDRTNRKVFGEELKAIQFYRAELDLNKSSWGKSRSNQLPNKSSNRPSKPHSRVARRSK
jgi:hypothetical protein